jgi:hypothetical protein
MNGEPALSRHASDDELIEYLYIAESSKGTHLASCAECRQRLVAMHSRRQAMEAEGSIDLSFEALAAQRRAIYDKLSEPAGWRFRIRWPRWVPAAAALIALGGGIAYYQESRVPVNLASHSKISDAQLAADVSRVADESAPPAAEPLEAFFQE